MEASWERLAASSAHEEGRGESQLVESKPHKPGIPVCTTALLKVHQEQEPVTWEEKEEGGGEREGWEVTQQYGMLSDVVQLHMLTKASCLYAFNKQKTHLLTQNQINPPLQQSTRHFDFISTLL